MKELLAQLCAAFGPSGREEGVREVIRAAVAPYCDKVEVDALGNLIAYKAASGKAIGQAPRLMLAAHMDQIGLIATHIDEKGYVRFAAIGGVSPRNALYRTVRFESGAQGVVGVEQLKLDYAKLEISKLFVDIGATGREEAEKMVQVGDMAVFESTLMETPTQYVSGALDDRVCCAMMIEALKKVQNNAMELACVFTVQEEVGLRGAGPAAFALKPAAALALDVTLSGDTPEAAPQSTHLGGGPAIKVKDHSVICHPQIVEWMEKVAKEAGIPVQKEVLTAGGTDAGAIHLTQAGIRSGALSLSTRYVHSQAECVSKKDLEQSVALLAALMESSI